MNKKNALFLLPAAALLASCAGGQGSLSIPSGIESASEPASAPASEPSVAPSITPSADPSEGSESSDPITSGWTTEEEALMKEHLGGHVLPYVDVFDLNVFYDTEGEELVIYFAWEEEILDTLVSVYEDAGYTSYIYSYMGLVDIFVGDLIDEEYNALNVYGMEYYENEDDANPSFVELFPTYSISEDSWPAEDVASYVTSLGSTVTVPSFDGACGYIVSEGSDYLGIACIGGFKAYEGENTYKTALNNAGWTIDESYYDDYGYYATSADGKVEINFYENVDGPLYIYIEEPTDSGDDDDDSSSSSTPSGQEEEVSSIFPADAFSTWLEYLGATDTSIPAFNYEATWHHDSTYEDNGWTYWYFEDAKGTIETVEDVYKQICVEAGYTIDATSYEEEGYYAIPEDDVYCIQFYFYEDYFWLGVGPYEEPEPIEEGVFDFSVKTQITESSASKVVWQSGDFTFTVEQNTADLTVGNSGAYLYGPLRIYTGHKVTISWPEGTNVESITCEVDSDSSKSDATNLTGATLTGCTASASGDIVTLTPEEGVNSISFVVTTKQVHLSSVTVNVAE